MFQMLYGYFLIFFFFHRSIAAVYVQVKEQTSTDVNNRHQVTLKFRLTARDDDFDAPEPLWKIKITQLECPVTTTNWWKIKDIARQIWEKEYEDDEDEDEVDEEEERKQATTTNKPIKYSLGMVKIDLS